MPIWFCSDLHVVIRIFDFQKLAYLQIARLCGVSRSTTEPNVGCESLTRLFSYYVIAQTHANTYANGTNSLSMLYGVGKNI